MTTLEIYEKVNIKVPIEQRVFFNCLNDSINEIAALHSDIPKTVFYDNLTAADIVPLQSLTDEMIILPLYHNAVVDNILSLVKHFRDEEKLQIQCGYPKYEWHKGQHNGFIEYNSAALMVSNC